MTRILGLLMIASACSSGAQTVVRPDAAPQVFDGALPVHPDAAPSAPDAAIDGDARAAEDAAPSAPDAAASSPDASTGAGACLNRACRDRITTDQDFAAIARVSSGCQFDREIFFMIPAGPGALFDDAYYVDANAHRHMIDFVRRDLGGRYSNVDVETYFRHFEREDTRVYYSGRIRRLAGTPARYGFDLAGSGYFGVGSGGSPAMQIEGIVTTLRQTFALPLGYAPILNSAVREAEQLGAVSFDLHLPAPCAGDTCPAGNGPCVVIPPGAQMCGRFAENRDIQAEHRRQIELTLAPGNHRLGAGATLPLFSGGSFGPTRTPVTPVSDARVVNDAGGWSIRQAVRAGNSTIELELPIWNPNQPTIMREPFMSEIEVVGVIDQGMSLDDLIRLGSCNPEGLPLYLAEADLGNNDKLRMEYRHQIPFAGSGPLIPTGADITLGGVTMRLDGHPSLIYAGVHHNWDNQFWLIFPRPITAFGHDVYGVWIDEASTRCCPVDSIRTLDANHDALDTLPGASYLRAPSPF